MLVEKPTVRAAASEATASETALNDLVGVLYRQVWPFYLQLHEASVDVRYGTGLRVPLDKLGDAQGLVKAEYAAGTLAAA